MKETVLVTGGAGYIGSHTAVELINAGFDVVIADNLSNSDLQAVEGVRRITGREIPFEQVDCCDREAFKRLFERYEFRSAIHFAASKAVGESVEQPLKYYRNNLTSFLNLVELMRDFHRPNILFSSSCTVYGEPDKQPVTEQTPRKPATSPYGNTKQMCEDILRDSIAAIPEMRGIALRYFNPIGAHPSALIGELPRGVPQNLLPYVTQTAAGIRECLSIFGDAPSSLCPATSMLPLCSVSCAPISFSRVDFPDPLCPRMATKEPWGISISIPSMARSKPITFPSSSRLSYS